MQIRVRHSCSLCELSAAFPSTLFTSWSDESCTVLQITASLPQDLDEILPPITERLETEEVLQDGRLALAYSCLSYQPAKCEIPRIAKRRGLWYLQPATFQEGWETFRLVAPATSPVREFVSEVSRVGEAEILSQVPRSLVEILRDLNDMPGHFFEGLTDRQIRALIVAYENGLIDVPARKKMGEVARRQGLARSTFGEHIRKAQQHLVRNSYPFLKRRLGSDETGEPEERSTVSVPQGRGKGQRP